MNKPIFTYSWIAFFTLISVVLLWFSASAVYHLYHYAILSAQAPAKTIEWSVTEINSERYLLHAQYTFEVQGETYSGQNDITSEWFRNRWAAEHSISHATKDPKTVWYSPRNPTNSSLETHFPLKECLSAVLLWGLLGYFYWLYRYLLQFDGGKSS